MKNTTGPSHRKYGTVNALEGMSFKLDEGKIFSFLHFGCGNLELNIANLLEIKSIIVDL